VAVDVAVPPAAVREPATAERNAAVPLLVDVATSVAAAFLVANILRSQGKPGTAAKAIARLTAIAQAPMANVAIKAVSAGSLAGGMAMVAVDAVTVAEKRHAVANHAVRRAVEVPAAVDAASKKAFADRFGTLCAAAPAATANFIGANGTTIRRAAAIRATNAATGPVPVRAILT